MVKVAWKVIKGNGPYAYLQKSVKKPNGSVTSQHLAYLGGIGKKGMFPGKSFNVPPTDDGQFDGGRVLINPVPDELKAQLKPAALQALESIEEQVHSGVPTQDIVVPKKGKTGQLGATGSSADQAPPTMTQDELGATGLPSEVPAKTHGRSPATSTTQSVRDAPPSLASLLPGYVSPASQVEYYEHLELATAASMAESGIPYGIKAAQVHAKTLQDTLPATQQAAINRARKRLTVMMLRAWIGSVGAPTDVSTLVANTSNRRLASAAAHGGIATLKQEAAKLKARKADPAEVEYIQSVVSLVKTHLPTELDVGVTAKPSPAPSPAPVNAEPTTPPPAGPVSSKSAKSAPPPKLSDLVPGYSTPKVSHQSHGELELVAAEAIKSTEDIRDGIRAARRYAEILKQELPSHEHSGVDTAVNWLTADILHATAKYTFGAPGWFPAGMGANDLYELAQAAGHGGLPGLEQKAQELSTSAAKATGVQEAVNTIKNFMPLDSRDLNNLAGAPEPDLAVASVSQVNLPKIAAVPKAANGKPLISTINVKKLEEVAATGGVETPDLLVAQIDANLLAPAKKAALQVTAADLKRQMGANKHPTPGTTQADIASSSPLTTPVSLPEVVASLESHHLDHPDYPLLQAQTLDAMKADGIAAGIASLRRGVGRLKKEALTSQWIELDNIGRWTTVHILTTAMKSPVGQILAPNVNVVHDLASTASLEGIVGMEARAAALAKSYPDAPAVAAQMNTLLPSDPSKAPKVTGVPTNSKGQPLVTQAEVQKLQNAANLGNIYHLNHTMEELSLGSTPTKAKKKALEQVVTDLRAQIIWPDGAPWLTAGHAEPAAATPTEAPGIGALAQTLQSVIEKKAAPEPVTASVPLAAPPIISHLPLDKNGKPNISAANVNKLHKEAAFGDVAALEVLGQELQDNLQSMTKKAAIAAAVSDLKSQMTASEGAQTIAIGSQASAQAYNPATPGADEQTTVNSGPENGPANSAAKAANIIELQSLLKSVAELKSQEPSSEAEMQKDWNAVLEPVSGPKGSNQGGLFKDQQTGALHYVKWSGSDVRPKVEVLAGELYGLAGVPVPGVRVIDYQGQTAVMSDWIDGAKPMTIDNMKEHPDVRENFVVDAWLANWDVIGLGADNIVLGPDDKAYRIDAGGSLLFRAQGKPKWFPPFVEEHKTLLDKGKNPNSAQVFEGLTNEELLAGAEKVASVTDSQIDDVVDALDLPKTSRDFGDSDDIPMLLKWSLKKRRDYLVSEIEKQVGQKVPGFGQGDVAPPVAPPTPQDDSPSAPAVNAMPNVSATNQKKLEKAAASGDAQLLDKTGMKLSAALKSQGKQAAITNAVANLKAQIHGMVEKAAENDTGMSEAVESVSDGDVRLPRQSVPDPAVVEKQADLQGSGKKDYDADLELVDGKKGSTQGSLFKDKHLNTLHYVKWNNSEVRAKVEALTGALYALADVPVPIQRVIDFKDETAVMSDWLDDAVPMSMEDLKSHPDVRENFAVDAWLANWDVVGSNGVNIVKGPGGKAYRVDLGGALLFRAMGDSKQLPAEVDELTLLQDFGKNPMSAQVFANLTDERLKAGAQKVGKISDQQIDDAVDKLDIPKESPQYKHSRNLPMFLKKRLKERRDYVAKEVLNIIDLKKQKADAVKQQISQLEETSDLKPETLSVVLEHAPKMKLMMNHKQRRAIQDEVLSTELGKTKGKNASGAVSTAYNGWKGWADTPSGRLLRWASGEIDGTGDRELRRIKAFNEFLVGKHALSQTKSASQIAEVTAAAESPKGANLTEGLNVTRKANRVASVIQNPGEDRITLYRGWRPIQVEYLQLQDAQVGDIFALDDPPVYSWSLDLSTAKSFGHGSIVTKAEVPIDRLILTDRMNNTGNHATENEVLFKGGDAQQMEVLYRY